MSYSFLGGDSRENFSDQEDLCKVVGHQMEQGVLRVVVNL